MVQIRQVARFTTHLVCVGALSASLSLVARPAFAESEQFTKGYYLLSWNGIALGRIRTELRESATRYSLSIDTKSKSLAAVISPFQTIAVAEGIKRAERFIPERYTAYSERSDEGNGRKTEITYDAEGNIRERIRTPMDDPTWRPEVPLKKANRATDPVTAFFIMRQSLRRNIEQGIQTSTYTTYDGRRLARFAVTMLSRTTKTLHKEPTAILRARFTRTPLDGYTPKEWKKFKEGDPIITATFRDDASLLPLRIDVKVALGTVSIVHTQEK